MQQPSRANPPKKHVILFLAANPPGTRRLALDEEAHSVHVELKRSGHRDRFDFVTRWAAEPLDLLRELRELKPTVVHFAGHGGGRPASLAAIHRDVLVPNGQASSPIGLYLHTAAGGAQLVTAEAIARAFGSVGSRVHLVVLNACYSASIAEALLEHVDCVVGMTGAIHDDAARTFAIGFYGGLGEHESVAAAFKQGQAAIDLHGLADAEQPQLNVRKGFDAAQLILAALQFTHSKCPYPGMRTFEADDADSFYGRDAEINQLIDRLRAGERELFVIGPSGSGKSSVVKAGILPQLARGLSGLGPFIVRELRPGRQPATQLARVLGLPAGEPVGAVDRVAELLAQCGPGSSLLIFVDQLEELFTQSNADESEQFLAALRALRAEVRCAVVFTLRADFFGALMESTLWSEQRGKVSRVEVSPLRDDALREAIAAPAEKAGVTVEPKLIERLVADAASEPGILPLLQDTMVQLWDAARGRDADATLTLANYQALGDGVRSGLAIALARRADATLRRFTEAEAEIARRILLRLVSFGEGRPDTRQQQSRSKLCTSAAEAYVLGQLIEHRLLTSNEGYDAVEPRIDLAHEAMIAAWPTLADWIKKHRADEQRRRQLEAAATQWIEYGRGVRGLLDPIELADAAQWQTESAAQLGQSIDVIALIETSRAVQIRLHRRRRLIRATLGLLGLVAVAFWAAFWAARNEAEEERRLTDINRSWAEKNRERVAQSYSEAGRQLLIDGRYQEAVPYLVAARHHGEDSGPLRMMFWKAKQHLPLVPSLEHQAEVVSAAFSPDGTRVVTATSDGDVRVWDAVTGRLLSGPLAQHAVSAAFRLDNTHVVSASQDGTTRVWDTTAGAVPESVADEASLEVAVHEASVLASALGEAFLSAVTRGKFVGDENVFDVTNGRIDLLHVAFHGMPERNGVVALSLDGARVVVVDTQGIARVWDAVSRQPLTAALAYPHTVVSAAFSPDGTRLVTVSEKHTAQVWEAATGRPLTGPLAYQASVVSAAVSSDGTRLLAMNEDHSAQVWDVATGQPLGRQLVHQAAVVSAAFSPNGALVVTASLDKTARVWDAATGQPLGSPLVHQAAVRGAAFSPNGTRVVTASLDKTARVWDAATGKPLSGVKLSGDDPDADVSHSLLTIRAAVHPLWVVSAAFSADGTRVITASEDKTARVWDAATGMPLVGALVHQDTVASAVFSPDGTRAVTASRDKTAQVWDAATGRLLTLRLKHEDAVVSAAFSPDGTRVVTASRDRTAQVWDAVTGQRLTRPLAHQASVVGATFSFDGRRVVTASLDHTAQVWDTVTGKQLTRPLVHQAAVVGAAFSPNGTRVVTASYDSTARVWDAATGIPLVGPLVHQGMVVSAAFSPDGSRVVTASFDHTARVWDATSGQPLTRPLQHQDGVVSAAFSPDGRRIVTASADHTARVWDVMSGQPLTQPLQHQADVRSAVFSPDGNRVVTAGANHTARVWDVRHDPETLNEWARVAECSPFVLDEYGVLVRRSVVRADTTPSQIVRSVD